MRAAQSAPQRMAVDRSFSFIISAQMYTGSWLVPFSDENLIVLQRSRCFFAVVPEDKA